MTILIIDSGSLKSVLAILESQEAYSVNYSKLFTFSIILPKSQRESSIA